MHVYGPDSYRRGRAIREIVAQYLKKYPDGTVGHFDCAEKGAVEQLREFAAAPGLFAKAALAIVQNPGDGEKPLAKLLKEVSQDPHVTVLVVADKKLPKDFALLYGDGVGPKKKEFDYLTGIEFLKFLKAAAADRELVITDEKLKAIGGAYAGDTWGAVTEIERVARGGSLVERGPAFDFIGLIRGMNGQGGPAGRLRNLFLLLESDDAAKVFNMVAAFASGADKVRMADYDVAVKSGRFGYDEALLEYVLR